VLDSTVDPVLDAVLNSISDTVPAISGRLKGTYPWKEYVPIGPRASGVGLRRQTPPVMEVVVDPETLHPVTIVVDVEQVVVALPSAEPVPQATKTSVAVSVASHLELEADVSRSRVFVSSSRQLDGSDLLSSGGSEGPCVHCPIEAPNTWMQGR
jgi:hypothetical protein